MQGVTLDVILRTVFGLDEGPAKRELRAALIELLGDRLEPAVLLAAQQANGNGAGAVGRFFAARERVDRLLFAEIAARRRADVTGRADILSLLVQATLRGRPAARGPGAARRADDDAARRPRDHGDGARLGGEPRARATRDVRARLLDELRAAGPRRSIRSG